MISQKKARQLIQQWEESWRKLNSLYAEHSPSWEINDTASILVWIFIQLKQAGYCLSEDDLWYLPTVLN